MALITFKTTLTRDGYEALCRRFPAERATFAARLNAPGM